MSSETLLIIAGVILSLAFSYVPGLASWYNLKDDTVKRLIMLGLIAVTAGAVFGLSCADLWVDPAICTKDGGLSLLTAFFLALMANQGVNSISPKVGLKSPIAKNVVISLADGDTTVGMTALGTVDTTTAAVLPEDPDESQVG